jgi:hypothetical protein
VDLVITVQDLVIQMQAVHRLAVQLMPAVLAEELEVKAIVDFLTESMREAAVG